MVIDIDRFIGQTTRAVARRPDGARVVTAIRRYDTSVEDLWDAITSPERLPRWFLPVSGDLRAGGRYQLEGNASGDIVRCEPPRVLRLTWEFDGHVSRVNVELTEAPDGGAILTLEDVADYPDDLWETYGAGAGGVGWDQALLGLERHVVHGTDTVPADVEAWLLTDDGRRFVARSSDAWCEASIASGTEPRQARAAAMRTTAAYTGEEVGPSAD